MRITYACFARQRVLRRQEFFNKKIHNDRKGMCPICYRLPFECRAVIGDSHLF